MDPSRGFLLLSDLRCRIPHKILFRASGLSRTRPPGSLRLNGSCKFIAINTVRLGGEGGGDDTTCVQ